MKPHIIIICFIRRLRLVAVEDSGIINRRHHSPSHRRPHRNYPIAFMSNILPYNPAPPWSSHKMPMSQPAPPSVIHAQTDKVEIIPVPWFRNYNLSLTFFCLVLLVVRHHSLLLYRLIYICFEKLGQFFCFFSEGDLDITEWKLDCNLLINIR